MDALDPEVRKAYDQVPGKLQIHRLFALAPQSFIAGRRYSAAVMGVRSLSKRHRHIVVLLTAALEDGEYEWVQHEPVARACGCTGAEIEAIRTKQLEDPAFDDQTRALVRFTSELVLEAGASEPTTRATLEHFSPQQLMEALLVSCLYMTVTRVTRTAGLPPEEGVAGLANVGSVDSGSSYSQRDAG